MARYESDHERWLRSAADREWRGGGGYGYGGGEMGWSRPEFNASLGAWGGHQRDDARGDRGFRAAASPGTERREWRSARYWSPAPSPAVTTAVREIMTENPEAVLPDTPLVEVARRMRDLDVGIIPIVRDVETGVLEGVITDRDIAVRAAAEGKDMRKATAGQYMTRDIEAVHESDTVRKVFAVMKRRRVRRVPVTDDAGRLVGIVAQADLAVDYAGLDLDRETEVEEVLERISEPARPRPASGMRHGGPEWGEPGRWMPADGDYGRDFRDRLRGRWEAMKADARHRFYR